MTRVSEILSIARRLRSGTGKIRAGALEKVCALGLGFVALLWSAPVMKAAGAIPVAQLERPAPVDFATEILPIFRSNCVACHNQTKSKAELVLETPQTILKGSENGPVVLPGQGEASLLLQVASHQKKPTMPPRDNKVAAVDLTSQELGLIKLWIDQGARGEVHGGQMVWQSLPESYDPIYAVALSPDGQIAACTRANQIYLSHLPTGRLLTCLTDPRLPGAQPGSKHGVAHQDAVHALAFSPDGNILASGGYREVKLWRRKASAQTFQVVPAGKGVTAVALSPDGRCLATADQEGHIMLTELPPTKPTTVLPAGTPAAVRRLRFSPSGNRLLAGSEDRVVRLWDVTDHSLVAEARTDSPVSALAWLDEGAQQFAAATRNGLIQVWTASCQRDGPMRRLAEFRAGEDQILSLHGIVQCPEEVLTAGVEGIMRLWNARSGVLLRELRHGGPIVALAIEEDGKRYASVGLDNSVCLWGGESAKEIARLKGERHVQDQVASKERALRFATNEVAYSQSAFESAEKERKAQTDRVRKAIDALGAAEKNVSEKRKKLEETANATTAAEKTIKDLDSELAKATQSYHATESAAEQARLELTACLQALADGARGHSSAPEAITKPAACPTAQALAEAAADQLLATARAAGQAKQQFDGVAAEKNTLRKQANEKLTAARKQAQEAEAEVKKASQTQSNAENELTLAISSAQKAADLANDAQNAIPLAHLEAKRVQAELEAAKRASAASEKPVYAAAFSPDNQIVATGGDDGLVHTWSAETGEAWETLLNIKRVSSGSPSAPPTSWCRSARMEQPSGGI